MKRLDFCAGGSGSPAYRGLLRGYLGLFNGIYGMYGIFFAYVGVKKSADLELFKGVFDAFWKFYYGLVAFSDFFFKSIFLRIKPILTLKKPKFILKPLFLITHFSYLKTPFSPFSLLKPPFLTIFPT
jgi:hypothetical protein